MILKINVVAVTLLLSLIALSTNSTMAQERTIYGVVSDDGGLPVPATTVLVKGSGGSAVVSDFDGHYSISAVTGHTLVFSIANQHVELIVGKGSEINAVLEPEVVACADTPGAGKTFAGRLFRKIRTLLRL